MTKQMSKFRGIFSINEELIEPFSQFLKEREDSLACGIQRALKIQSTEEQETGFCTLNQMNQELAKADLALQGKEFNLATRQINQGYWNYLEVLEGGITELFQQLNQLIIDEWNDELVKVLGQMTTLITQKLEELDGAFERTEEILDLVKNKRKEDRPGWSLLKKLWPFSSSHLDQEISSNIKKSKRFLSERYAGFINRYNQNNTLNEQAKFSLKKFANYSLLQALSPSQQETFHFTYRILKIWEMDARTKAILTDDLIRFAKKSLSGDKAQKLFKVYSDELNKKLFEISRSIKEPQPNNDSRIRIREIALKSTKSFRKELKTLERLVARYREFLLRTDPNPYVRARVGFAEWVLGPEPTSSKKLLHLEYDLADLDAHYTNLTQVLESGSSSSATEEDQDSSCYEIKQLLHSMALPLNSQKNMRTNAERLVELLQEFDEVGSMQPWAIAFVERTLEKALHADWKHHYLHEIRAFHQLYATHIKLIDQGDAVHEKRFKEAKEMVQNILKWVGQNQGEAHIAEIDEYSEKMRSSLEALLEDIESALNGDKEQLTIFHQHLLQYRYLFGGLFHTLEKNHREGKSLRQHFLSIDRILETIDNRLEIRE